MDPKTIAQCPVCGTLFQQKRPCYPAASCSRKCGALLRAKRSPVDRFWENVEKTGTCWFWRGSLDARGYGQFLVNRRTIKTHRFAWELANGAIPAGLSCCHKCDRPRCCNPAHLFLGTHADNMLDMARKLRSGLLKLTPEMVVEARGRAKAGEDLQSIGDSFGVHKSAIHKAVSGVSWRWLR